MSQLASETTTGASTAGAGASTAGAAGATTAGGTAAGAPPLSDKDKAALESGVSILGGVGAGVVLLFALIPAIFALMFALGAAQLSYQKYGSMPWAVLDFFFPYLYYPYYAFYLSREQVPQPGMFGGKRSLVKMMFGKWFK